VGKPSRRGEWQVAAAAGHARCLRPVCCICVVCVPAVVVAARHRAALGPARVLRAAAQNHVGLLPRAQDRGCDATDVARNRCKGAGASRRRAWLLPPVGVVDVTARRPRVACAGGWPPCQSDCHAAAGQAQGSLRNLRWDLVSGVVVWRWVGPPVCRGLVLAALPLPRVVSPRRCVPRTPALPPRDVRGGAVALPHACNVCGGTARFGGWRCVTRRSLPFSRPQSALTRSCACRVSCVACRVSQPVFVPHVDVGDWVVVVNAKDVALSGTKSKTKLYRWHTGFPGGLKELTARHVMERKPERILESAVMGMLPKTKLRRVWSRKLRIFADGHQMHYANTSASAAAAPEYLARCQPQSYTLRPKEETGDFVLNYEPKADDEAPGDAAAAAK
jgi:large subunit ribosomal protein L13